jgi:1,4-dihydroxy-2-naphthoate polyprenyltransferase
MPAPLARRPVSSTAARPAPARVWLEATRPRTLPAAVAPVLVGAALAARLGHLDPWSALACLLFAVLIQIGTNFANDYFDARKGADTPDRVGPRRAVASGLISPGAMRAAMIVVFVAAFAVGMTLFFLPHGGWPLLGLGLLSIACGVAYTGGRYALAYVGLGDVFVFVFFGLVAVGATFYVQHGLWPIPWPVLAAGAGVGALATNILVVNNYRDVETDARARKRTLVVRWGRGYARAQFGLAHLVAIAAPLALGLGRAAQPILAAAIALGCAVEAWAQVRGLRVAAAPGDFLSLLGRTGRHVALYGVSLAFAVIAG